MTTVNPPTYIILGAGVIGLTTSLELAARHPTAGIVVVAKYLPGDRHPSYASPWAGANWVSSAHDGGKQEGWDRVTYSKFGELATRVEETGVRGMGVKCFYDRPVGEAGVVSEGGEGKGKIWYEDLTGMRWMGKEELPEGCAEVGGFGVELETFVIDVQVYLPWLQNEARKNGIEVHRRSFDDIQELFGAYPKADAYFNCTGLGAYSLKGVEDKDVYPTRGQTVLVENPKTPLTRMYTRSPQRVNKDTTYVFPRGLHNGVILGGCRLDNEWNGDVNLEFAEDIKRRCCTLAPELGRPEDLKVISHGVGLRPSRKGGPRVERERFGKRLVVHNYGAGGAGYQASWGMAKEAVDLLQRDSKL